MYKFFSVVIPTMWMSDKILDMLSKYEKCELIREIIIIDNNPKNKIDLSSFSKIVYYSEGYNIFVNPAWNIGNLLSKYELILANDDIVIDDIDSILKLISSSDYDIVGVRIGNNNGKIRIDPIKNFPKNHFGSFMYIKNYYHIPNTIKIWFGDDLQFDYNNKKGILINSGISSNESKTVNSINNSIINEVYLRDKEIYNELKPTIHIPKLINKKQSILAVLVNYGDEQLSYLRKVVKELKSFKKYNVKVIVNSNIPLKIKGIDVVNVYDNLKDYQLLPITCRKVMWEEKDNFDIFLFGENDHLFKEVHVDRFLEYCDILPKDKIAGLIQYEENETGKYYPAFHKHYNWDYDNVEIYGGKLFAHFTNIHQATFILTKEQLNTIGENYNFSDFYGPRTNYSVKCRVNTDIYGHSGLKKLICISDFNDSLIHHLPNVYINGDKGRNKNQRSDNDKMLTSLIKLFNFGDKKIVCGIATIYERKDSLKQSVESIINQVDELYVYQNGYKESFSFLENNKITVISSVDTGIVMGDAGKFYTVENHKDCYYLSIDDDIIYPKDYVLSIVEGIKKYKNKKIVTHHGRKFDENVTGYHSGYIDSVHFRRKNNKHKQIHFPGTGVMGFYTNTFKIKFSDFKIKNIADVIVGIESAKQNVECICLPHDSDWLKDTDFSYETTKNSLFERNKTNIELNKYFLENIHFIFQKTELPVDNKLSLYGKINELVQFNPNKERKVKHLDYDKINKVLNKDKQTPNNPPEKITQNKPENRNEITKLRRDSIVAQTKRVMSVRPSAKNIAPHVFGGKNRQ